MPELKWTGRGRFSYSDWIIRSGETVEVDEDEAEELLNHRTGGWEEVEPTAIDAIDEPDEDVNDGDGDAVEESDDATDPEEMPEASNDDESVPDYETFPREDLESMEWDQLRSIAVDSDHDGINGRSSRDEIVEALAEN